MSTSERAPGLNKAPSSPDKARSRRLREAGLSLNRHRTPFEWGLLTTALFTIRVVLTGLFFYADKRAGGEAELTVKVRDTGKQFEGGRQVELTVRNTGGAGAEEVVTEVTMGSETREVSMVRIPKHDESKAIVSFPPGISGKPEAELLSYVEP